jgi:signal transduction histidine kinase
MFLHDRVRQTLAICKDVAVLLFQTVRELLVNVVKHAQAQKVTVAIGRNGGNVQITVEDDGVGFDPSDISSRWNRNGGFGLFSIRERLGHLGGQLKVRSKSGHGTRVSLVAPLKCDETTLDEIRSQLHHPGHARGRPVGGQV